MRVFLGGCVGAVVLAVAVMTAGAATYYVSAGADPGGDGSPGSPFRTIQEGINIASPAGGDTVIVLAGVYAEHVDFLTKDVVVQSEDPYDPAVVAATVIDGTNTGTAVTLAGGQSPDAALAGFTITDGCWSDPTVMRGGGMHIENASPTVFNNIVTGNYTATDGGGIAIVGESLPVILDNTVSANEAGGWGGGIFIFGDTSDPEDIRFAAPQVVGNRVTGNQAEWDGGGIACFEACAPALKANVIDSNSAGQVGGGLFVGFGVEAGLQNLTLADNDAMGSDVGGVARVGRGGGLAWWHSGTNTANSCIFWGGTAKDDEGPQASLEGGSNSTIAYCDVQEGQVQVFKEADATLTWGTGNCDTDPLFAPAAGDYHLQSTAGRFDPVTGLWVTDALDSPLIDAGDPALSWEDEPSPHGRRVNIGGYGTTPQASRSAGLPISLLLLKNWDWTYQNTQATTEDRHLVDVYTVVLQDPNLNTSYAVEVTKAGGSGDLTIEATADPLMWHLVGSRAGVGSTGTVDVRFDLFGDVGGQGSGNVTITVRPLGDIDGSGSVTGLDKQTMNQRLNNVSTGYPDRVFDLTGEGSVTGVDKQVMNMLLNNVSIP